MNKLSRKQNKKRGGSTTAMPMKYYNSSAYEPSANSGRDLLRAIPPIGVRPRIGGRRKLTKKLKGGAITSILEGFTRMASRYIVPIALYAGYRLMTKNNKKSKKDKKDKKDKRTYTTKRK